MFAMFYDVLPCLNTFDKPVWQPYLTMIKSPSTTCTWRSSYVCPWLSCFSMFSMWMWINDNVTCLIELSAWVQIMKHLVKHGNTWKLGLQTLSNNTWILCIHGGQKLDNSPSVSLSFVMLKQMILLKILDEHFSSYFTKIDV